MFRLAQDFKIVGCCLGFALGDNVSVVDSSILICAMFMARSSLRRFREDLQQLRACASGAVGYWAA